MVDDLVRRCDVIVDGIFVAVVVVFVVPDDLDVTACVLLVLGGGWWCCSLSARPSSAEAHVCT